MKFKDKFVIKYSKLTNFEEYKESVVYRFARKSIRVNTLNKSVYTVTKSLLKDGWKLEKVPWCKEGYYIEHESGRRDIGNTKQHEKGWIFSQGAQSMIPAQLMGFDSTSYVLDMCAAPGGKTNHISCLMKNKGRIIANESNSFRMNILKLNMARCGVKNAVYSNRKAEDFVGKDIFDAVLVDAPCTGSGLIKGKIARTKKLLKEWNPKVTNKYARLQRRILNAGYNTLKNGGRLVYVTCSMEPEEDELLIESFLDDNKDCELLVPKKINNVSVKSSLKDYIKIWPQYYNTHGMFIAVLEKN